MWIWVATASRIVGQQSAETNPSKGSRSLNSAPCRQLPSSCATGGPGLHQVRNQQFHCIPLLPCMSKTDRKKTTAKSFKLLSRQTPGISKTFGSHPAPPTFQGTVFNATHKFKRQKPRSDHGTRACFPAMSFVEARETERQSCTVLERMKFLKNHLCPTIPDIMISSEFFRYLLIL